MGRKGAKLSEKATAASEKLEIAVAGMGEISRRRMFGGYGIFESGKMFALVTSEGEIYFKVSDSNRKRFEDAGSDKFGRMPYFELPDEVLADETAVREWATSSIEAAHGASQET